MIGQLKNIAYYANAQTRFLLMDVMRRLKDRHGSNIHLYCNTTQDLDFYTSYNRENLFASMNIGDQLLRVARDVVDACEDAAIAEAKAWERKIGCGYNFLSVANRHLGRGYALGGAGHPRSRISEDTSYLQMVNAYNAHFAFWQAEIEKKQLTLFVGGPREIPPIARAHGLPFRTLAGSKHENFHYWARDEFLETPDFEKAFQDVRVSQSDVVEITRPYKLVGTVARRMTRDRSFPRLVSQLARHGATRAYWRLRGYEKGKNYFVADELWSFVRRWRDARRLSGPNVKSLVDLQDTPFVFFPLQTEPEMSLQGLSPEFVFQHAAIAALARDLPTGIRLAVKETMLGVGRRPRDFYDQISSLKNVVMLDVREPGIDVVRKSKAVAVISGTPGFEAAINGIPVISFGEHALYNFLPHVQHVTDLANLRPALKRIFDGSIDLNRSRLDGTRFLRSVMEASFDMGDYDYVKLKNYDSQVVEDAYQALIDSLEIIAESRSFA